MTDTIEKHKIRTFSAIVTDGGVVLCDDFTGAFLTLRFTDDLDNLKKLLGSISTLQLQSEGK